MEKYVLISVYERNIQTEIFDTFSAAVEQMTKKVKENYEENSPDSEITWEEFLECSEDFDDIGISLEEGWAWSNLDGDCNCDWKIVMIE